LQKGIRARIKESLGARIFKEKKTGVKKSNKQARGKPMMPARGSIILEKRRDSRCEGEGKV